MMPDGTSTLIDMIWSGAKYVWALLLGLVVWNGKRMVKKVDDLERCSVQKDDFNATLKSLREDISGLGEKQIDLHRTMRADTREDIKGVHQRIDELMKR